MKITRKHLKGLIMEEVKRVDAESHVDQALEKIKGSKQALSALLGKGEVSVDVNDYNITVKTEKPMIYADSDGKYEISKDIKSDIDNLDVIVQKRIGGTKRFSDVRLAGNVSNPFDPRNRGFGIRLAGKF
jgi:hypothetical protein